MFPRLLAGALATLSILIPASVSSAARLDPEFGHNGRVVAPTSTYPTGLATMSDGGILIATRESVERLTPAGPIDQSFGTNGYIALHPTGTNLQIWGIAVDSQNRIVVGGTYETPSGGQSLILARFLPDGTPDPSFGVDGSRETDLGLAPPQLTIVGVATDSSDRILVTGGAFAGYQTNCAHDWFEDSPTDAAFVARFTPTGTLDTSYGGGDGVFAGHSTHENPLLSEIASTPMVGPGDAVTYGSGLGLCPREVGTPGFTRLTADGQIDRGFGEGGAVHGNAEAAALDSRGSISYLSQNSTASKPWHFAVEAEPVRVTRLLGNGRRMRSFGRHGSTVVRAPGGPGSTLEALAVRSDRGVLLEGTVLASRKTPSGIRRGHRKGLSLVALDPSGKPDRSFGPRGALTMGFGGLRPSGYRVLVDSQDRALLFGIYGSGAGTGMVIARVLLGS